MKKDRLTGLMCLVVIGFFSAKLQAAGPGKQTNLPVTSIIADSDPLGTPFQIQSDDDDGGEYTNTKAVQSIIQPIGDWVLNTNYSSLSLRGVYLDFSRPVDGTSPGLDNDFIGVKARLITQCPTYGYSMLTLANGTTVQCGLVIAFDYGGNHYRLAMNPDGPNHYPGTTTVKVSRNDDTHWTIEGGNGTLQTRESVAALIRLTDGRKPVEVNLGNFYFSFSISVTNP